MNTGDARNLQADFDAATFPDLTDSAAIQAWSAEELRSMCASCGLASEGRKSELAARLAAHATLTPPWSSLSAENVARLSDVQVAHALHRAGHAVPIECDPRRQALLHALSRSPSHPSRPSDFACPDTPPNQTHPDSADIQHPDPAIAALLTAQQHQAKLIAQLFDVLPARTNQGPTPQPPPSPSGNRFVFCPFHWAACLLQTTCLRAICLRATRMLPLRAARAASLAICNVSKLRKKKKTVR